MDSSTPPSLGQQALRTAWIFQALCALPIMFIMGGMALSELFYPYLNYYDFFTESINALFAAFIIFLVLVQRKLVQSNTRSTQTALESAHLTMAFEIYKASIATAMWVWLMLDSAFYVRYNWADYRKERIVRSALAVIILFVVFYPTARYSYLIYKEEKKKGDHGDEDVEAQSGANQEGRGETTPLLRE